VVNLTPYALLFTVAAIGVSETSYLIRARRAASGFACPIGQDCAVVLTSKYNHFLPFVHNDILGLIFYLVFTALAALFVLGIGQPTELMLLAEVILAGATLMSAIFTYLQWRVIKAWCFWCLMSAGTVVLLDLIMLKINFTI